MSELPELVNIPNLMIVLPGGQTIIIDEVIVTRLAMVDGRWRVEIEGRSHPVEKESHDHP